jgi:hypothetical protein
MTESKEGGSGKRPYTPPTVSSEIIQDLSAGGCGKCPNGGVDASDCSAEPILGTS